MKGCIFQFGLVCENSEKNLLWGIAMKIWFGRFLFGLGMFMAIIAMVLRRTHNPEAFREGFGFDRGNLFFVLLGAMATIGVATLILKKSGDMD